LSSLRAVLRDEATYDYSLPEIVDKYHKWVLDDRYMILRKVQFKDFQVRDSMKNQFLSYRLPVNTETIAVKCSKRGNDVYRSRVYRRFKDFASLSEKLDFFNEKDRGKKRTRALWVTLTYNTKLCSFKEAWRNVGIEFNRFMAYVYKKIGKVSCCRVWESFENGHPHIHCILLFEKKEFTVFRDGKGNFRIHEKDIIAQGWHSLVDIKAMSSLGRGFSYLKKYLLKSINSKTTDSKTLKTLALCWLFCKRAFSVSGKFRQMLTDLIKTKHNSNHKTQQTTLDGEKVQEYVYYLLGFVPADVIRLKEDLWFTKLGNEQIKSIEQFLDLTNKFRVKF
jgi:hypothetical protein